MAKQVKQAAQAAQTTAATAATAATPAQAPGLALLATLAAAPNAPAVLGTLAAQPHLGHLPKHLASKVASSATGGTQATVPAGLQGYKLANGKWGKPRAAAEIAWAAYLQTALRQPQSAAALLAGQPAGLCLGVHTLAAYLKRGWLVKTAA